MNIGKKQAFKRRFNFWTALGITFCVTSTWAAINGVVFQALVLAGPVGLLYGYILCAAAMTCVAASLAEFARVSIWPSSGAQYHWVAELAPKRWRGELSWFAGWATFGGAWCATVLCAISVCIQSQAYAIIYYPDYTAQRWHVYLIYLLVCSIYLCINLFGVKWLNALNWFGMGIHVTGFLTTVIVVAVTTKNKQPSSYVFTTFQNGAGWKSNGVAFCISIMTSMNGFSGIESAAHFAEEIQDAPLSLPRAMFWTVAFNSIITLPWIILLLYSIGDLSAVLASPIAQSSAITQVFANSFGVHGAIALSSLATYLAFLGGADSMGSCARTIWAMARDDAFPAPYRKIHKTLDVPVYPLLTVYVTQILVGMIYIWNTTAFFGITSGGIALFTISYALPIGLQIFHGRHNPDIFPGPWSLGRLGLPVNILAFIWLIFITVFLCFPIYYPVTPKNMNYASLIVGSFGVLSSSIYFLYGRGRFYGPIVEVNLGVTVDDVSSQGATEESTQPRVGKIAEEEKSNATWKAA
ncbi:amino acid transporter [Cucurbitaria berberidis CBS 394.84]|uniref:Amino acid transporter n=1 Tax=Cucurbitaria berberidis CBS 394.84 TaxID=1168544 RepID=A0A9P4GDL7_9PLEO|nr:amino acid transporter [Cucurbitaria berberidis CBS 394.84]KAF1843677.1 amino acid transporter [Cucurbitaria berberidis CBS 394.84]